MSGLKNVDADIYNDEDYDEYGNESFDQEEQALSQEDQEQMRQGVRVIREQFGIENNRSDKEIEEALWYYYYDIPKTAAYLRKKWNLVQQPGVSKKPKQPSKFEQAAQAAQSKPVGSSSVQSLSSSKPFDTNQCFESISAVELFKDIGWTNIPPHRLGNIIIEPLCPRAGLLGGSSTGAKPSKLAALAAARKKAQEDKRKNEEQGRSSESETSHQPSAMAFLDRLGTKKKKVDHESPGEVLQSNRNSEIHGSSSHIGRLPLRTYPKREEENSEASAKVVQPSYQALLPNINEIPVIEDLRGKPSGFAKTMLGNSYTAKHAHLAEDNLFTLPYPRNSTILANNPFAGPSPDDVVIHAQSKGAKNSKPAAKKASTSTVAVTDGVAAIKLDDSTKTKSKNLDIMAEFKKSNAKNSANFVVIGHVDHGKSTLMGRLLYDLKLVNQRSVEKLRNEATNIGKSSFALAWVMDSTTEERERGVTVDIATSNFETPRTRFTILDAPGHRDFIPNMIAGASQADFAVLVIDASANAFEAGLRGQTKEHALLVRSMGISRIIVAVNKMDMAQWSHDRFEEISQQTSAFLLAAGFQSKNIAFIPCAGLSGENVVTRLSEGTAPWHMGHTLIEELDASEPSIHAIKDPLRLTVSDIFRGGIQNPLSISGRLDAGALQIGDVILAMPAIQTATVKGIEVDGAVADWAVAGQIATLHLSDIDPVHLRSGDIICSPTNKPVTSVRAFTAKILAFEHITPGWVDVHKGRLHAPAKITALLATLEKSSGAVDKKRPRIVKPGVVARIRVELEKPIPLEVSGRVVLRSEGVTIAAGLVEEVE